MRVAPRPGRGATSRRSRCSRFIDEVRHLRRWLRKPFVSVALDPEWNVGRNGVPGQEIGHTNAKAVNRVARYLAGIVREYELPQKLMVVHQFTHSMIRQKHDLEARRAIDLVLNADGFGTPAAKRSKYEQLAPMQRTELFAGFKLFYEEDTNLMRPRQVMRLRPRRPDFIVHE